MLSNDGQVSSGTWDRDDSKMITVRVVDRGLPAAYERVSWGFLLVIGGIGLQLLDPLLQFHHA